jgi:glycosyltransferase involved in cell wall biosynthesis
MLRELSNHHVGIIGWAPHWFHKFCNPNKAYEYMQAGLVPVVPSTLTPVIDMCNGYAKVFSNYDELTQVLRALSTDLDKVNESRTKIYEFSRRALLWENYEGNILEAYSISTR